ncbi:hypothetical protein DFJ77DRAFT_46430 [Powellomyces hirtus]|nr:hypothetical protein DFJ77DRAFT_46430 [Powellomyces hirtus]
MSLSSSAPALASAHAWCSFCNSIVPAASLGAHIAICAVSCFTCGNVVPRASYHLHSGTCGSTTAAMRTHLASPEHGAESHVGLESESECPAWGGGVVVPTDGEAQNELQHDTWPALSCPHDACPTRVRDMDALTTHIPVCPWRRLRHRRCGATVLARELDRHKAVCSSSVRAPTQTPQRARRVALVVGVSTYRESADLASPGHDARAVGAVLRDTLGFEAVTTLLDPCAREFEAPVDAFCARIDATTIAVWVFSGHGGYETDCNGGDGGGRNVVLLSDETRVDVAQVGQRIAETANPLFSVLVFDCCRAPLVTSNANNSSGAAATITPPTTTPTTRTMTRLFPLDFPASLVCLSCGASQRAMDHLPPPPTTVEIENNSNATTDLTSPFMTILCSVLKEHACDRDVRWCFDKVVRMLWCSEARQRATVLANLHEWEMAEGGLGAARLGVKR